MRRIAGCIVRTRRQRNLARFTGMKRLLLRRLARSVSATIGIDRLNGQIDSIAKDCETREYLG